MKTTASNIAKILVSFSNPSYGDGITNLKLQKLLYYSQGAFLAINKKILFDDNIIAWQYGPVVPSVYREYRKYGNGVIDPKQHSDFKNLSKEKMKLLREVYDIFGQFSALRLMEMTHSERPWLNADINQVIDTKEIKKYFEEHYIKD
jgi:uncharacterized phage-associated protein